MRKKARIALVLLIALALILVGCGKKNDGPFGDLNKSELIVLATNQMDELNEAYTRIDEVEGLLRGIQDEEVPSAAISVMNDGTGRLTFNSFHNKIIFPTPFEYPGSTQISNTASVNITKSLKVAPTSNWALRLKGTELELEHSSGISGTIKAGMIKEMFPREPMQEEIFAPFFEELPPDTVKYSKLFLDDNWFGLQAMTPTFIDSEEAYLRMGMLGIGEQCFTYSFVYKGKPDAGKDEIVLSLLNTIEMFDQNLRVEQ